MRHFIILMAIFLSGCSARERVRDVTNEFLAGEKIAELNAKRLREISGMASSINNAKFLWVHNDAGNKAEVYLLDQNLDLKLTCILAGIENRDWEDIAIGPGPDSSKNYLYVGDIGDNDGEHRHKYVYRFEEPSWDGSGQQLVISSFEKITISLDDGAKDTETLLLDPRNKNLYLISKRESPVSLYEVKYPYSTTQPVEAKKLLSLPMKEIVGGDIAHDGGEIVIKNYDQIFYWKSGSGDPIQDVLKTAAREIKYEKEPQGEAIAFAHDGVGLYTISEVKKGSKVYLYFYQRKPD